MLACFLIGEDMITKDFWVNKAFSVELVKNCAMFPERRAAVEVETGKSITYGQLMQQIIEMAGFLRQKGVEPGTSILLHLYNSLDAMILHLAVQYVGAKSCFVDALVQARSLDYYVNATQCRIIATHCSMEQLNPDMHEGRVVLSEFQIDRLGIEGPGDFTLAPYSWLEDEVCYIYFTSGTTAEPKGVMLCSRNHENSSRIRDEYWKPVSASSKHLCFVPFSHGFGTLFLLPLSLNTCAEIYILRAFHPVRVLEAIERYGITHIYGVPSHYQQLLRLMDSKTVLSSLEMAFCAAAKLEYQVIQKWESLTGIILSEGYGLIETGTGVAYRIGLPSLGTGHVGVCPDPEILELAILDLDGHPQPPGVSGQIAVRGASVMKGYLNMEKETCEVMLDGWFLTGDEGHITADGNLFMTGRFKDIINIAGIKVSPCEVESVLLQHPAVEEAAAVAFADSVYGEVVKAFVRVKSGVSLSERELIQFSSKHLMSFQIPKHLEFVDSLPMTNMGKLDRKKLRQLTCV
jgi:long-chain acyl-CoA synthetase